MAFDPDGPQVHLQASHGFWGGHYYYGKALAYVFDVGVNGKHDWRVRTRKRGGKWTAFGSVIDAELAKRIAQQAIENPSEPRPSKFAVPLNLLGGSTAECSAVKLDPQTYAYICDVEIGAVKVESPNEQPQASGDDESINCSADDDAWTDWPPADGEMKGNNP
jgi:hypothetical protein